jgi:hypothetical protein
MVSNAFDKSKKIPMVYFPWSIYFVILLTSSIIASSVDLFFLNPYWWSDKILFFSTYFISRLYINFSSNLAKQVKTDIGL